MQTKLIAAAKKELRKVSKVKGATADALTRYLHINWPSLNAGDFKDYIDELLTEQPVKALQPEPFDAADAGHLIGAEAPEATPEETIKFYADQNNAVDLVFFEREARVASMNFKNKAAAVSFYSDLTLDVKAFASYTTLGGLTGVTISY